MPTTERSPGSEPWHGDVLAPGVVLERRYRLRSPLGRGGFGDVWAADELLPDGSALREVALKLLDPRLLAGGSWGVEAKILASLRHPALVTIFAAGTLDLSAAQPAVPFVAMERLLGATLGDVLAATGPAPWRRALRWAREIAAALDAIHHSRIVHLDLKPANLFLTREGSIKVLDFGIARRRDREDAGAVSVRVLARDQGELAFGATLPLGPGGSRALDATSALSASRSMTLVGSSGYVMGTPGFVAPEVLLGEEPSPAADAYGLASVVVELVTGELPQAVSRDLDTNTPAGLAAWWAEMRDATLGGRLRDLEAARMPKALAALLTRLLAPSPQARGVGPGELASLFGLVWAHPHGVPSAPFPGLDRPDGEWEGSLFGRHDEIQRLARELEVTPLLVVHGERAAGKRAVVLAGVVPELAKSGVEGRDAWEAVLVPRGAPLASVLAPRGGVEALVSSGASTAGPGLVIVVEGLQERLRPSLATRGPEPAAEELLGLVRGEPAPGVRVVWLVREEELAALPTELAATLRPFLRFLGPLSAAAARDLVEGPLALRGASLEGVDPIVGAVRRELAQGTPLPLVSFALAEAWRQGAEGDGASPRLSRGWSRSGGLTGGVASLLRRVLGPAGGRDRAAVERVLLLLSGESARRTSFTASELCAWVPGAESALVALEAANLVRVSAAGGDLSLGHASIASAKGPLGDARLTRAAELAAFDSLRDAALAWERSERSDGLLLRAGELDEATRAMPDPPAPLLELLRASRRKLRRERVRRGAGVLFLTALVAVALWLKVASDERARSEHVARREADERALLADVVSRARRAQDGWARAAWISEALRRGSADPTLVLDLVGGLANAPAARFLTLKAVSGPVPFGGGGWAVASGPGALLTWVELEPSRAPLSNVDEIPIDSTLEDLKHRVAPRVRELDLGEQASQLVAVPFDQSVAVVSLSGAVTIVRTRAGPDGPSGAVVAAQANLGCRGPLLVAEHAPVLACTAGDRVAIWDLRRTADPDGGLSHAREPGLPLDLAPDGACLALADGKRLALLPVEDGYALDSVALELSSPLVLARFSPSGKSLAVATRRGVEVLDVRDGKTLHRLPHAPPATRLEWDAGGLDLAVCSAAAGGRFHYLRPGGRDPRDPSPPARTPCLEPHALREGMELTSRFVGAHGLASALLLGERVLSDDLVLFSSGRPLPGLHFEGRSALDEAHTPKGGVAALARNPRLAAVEVEGEVHLYSATDGLLQRTERGKLLAGCGERLLAVRYAADAGGYVVVDLERDEELVVLHVEPSLVLAPSPGCAAVLVQSTMGELRAVSLSTGEPRSLGVLNGYVYDAVGAHGDVWLAVGSGELLRVREDERGVVLAPEVAARARPFAVALAPGAEPGELWFADVGGLSRVRQGVAARVAVLDSHVEWTDLAPVHGGTHLLLVSPDRLALLELASGEVVGTLTLPGVDRVSSWGSPGTLLAWGFERQGPPRGFVLPFDPKRSLGVARSASNLVVRGTTLELRD